MEHFYPQTEPEAWQGLWKKYIKVLAPAQKYGILFS